MDFKKLKEQGISKIEVPDVNIDEEKAAAFFHNKRNLAILFVLFIACFSAVFYFKFWVQRPEYSLANIRKAVATRNIGLFNKHVDLEGIYGDIFDATVLQSNRNPDEFNRSITAGLFPEKREDIVGSFVNATESAVKGEGPDTIALDRYGSLGKAVSLFCANMVSGQPSVVLNGMSIVRKRENDADVRMVVYDVGKKTAVPLDFTMEKMPDGQWKITRLSNLRAAYMKASDILDDSLEKMRAAEEDRLAQAAEERKRRLGEVRVLPENERHEASLQVRSIFRQRKAEVIKSGKDTMYRFISYVYAKGDKPGAKDSLSVYNDFIENEGSGTIRNSAAFVLTLNDRNYKTDFDRICFFSKSEGFMIDVDAWDRNGLGVIGDPDFKQENKSSLAFLTTTDGLGDVYKLMSKGDLQVVFYKGRRAMASFVADKRMAESIADAIAVNDIIKSKLAVSAGVYGIDKVSEEELADYIAAHIIHVKKEETNKPGDKEKAGNKKEKVNEISGWK